MSEYMLEMTGITKTFPGVRALDQVDLKVKKGSVHAIVGENGAGKSTLMKILMGIYVEYSGEVKFDGEVVHFDSVNDALHDGISMIHQELSPELYMTVAENIYLGREVNYSHSFYVNDKGMERETQKLLDQLDIGISPKAKMRDLTVAYMQMVEIAKACAYNARLIIMDEPTSSITEKETEQLFQIIRMLKKRGISVIYISHRLEEIFEVADEVSVLRDGRHIGTYDIKAITTEKLIEDMVGRKLTELYPKETVPIGNVALELKNFSKQKKFHDVNLTVHKGEILGLYGLIGAGRSEVMEGLFGTHLPDSGEVYIDNKKVSIRSPRDAIKLKIGFITEDRRLSGLFLPLSLKENMAIANLDEYRKGGLINDKRVAKDCDAMMKDLKIKAVNLRQIVSTLSGGNQQKVLVARWLLVNVDILIMDEPTRGIDVGAKAEIYKLMVDLAKMGKAIIMISSELPEVLGMSDRIMVMYEGKVTGEVSRDEYSQEKVMRLASGITD